MGGRGRERGGLHTLIMFYIGQLIYKVFIYKSVGARQQFMVTYTTYVVYRWSTEMRFILCTLLGEISPCPRLTVLPGPAWVLLNNICKE